MLYPDELPASTRYQNMHKVVNPNNKISGRAQYKWTALFAAIARVRELECCIAERLRRNENIERI